MNHSYIVRGVAIPLLCLIYWHTAAQGMGPGHAFFGPAPAAFGRPVYPPRPMPLDTGHQRAIGPPEDGRRQVGRPDGVNAARRPGLDALYWTNRVVSLSHTDVLRLMPYLLLHATPVAFRIPLIPPLFADQPHRYTSGFSWRRHPVLGGLHHHNGIDMAGPPQPVKATAAGLVSQVAFEPGYGLYIVIDHGNSYETLYGHLAGSFVRVGELVFVGQPIATLGRSGRVTGYHLHYAVKKSGVFLDPVGYLVAATQFITRYQPQLTALRQTN